MVGIITNIQSQTAERGLKESTGDISNAIAKLSSGNRINKASDDVAGLAVGKGFEARVTVLKSSLNNASQAGSMLSVADGALESIADILQRQSALASQAASGSLDPVNRGFLNLEFQGLKDEINRIADSTNFNGIKLLDGSLFEVAGSVKDDNAVELAESKIDIQFGNNVDRFLNIAAGTNNAVELETAIANGDDGVVLFHVANHGLTSGEDVVLDAGGAMDQFLETDIDGTHTVTVIDKDTFAVTLNNGGGAPQAIGMIAGGDVPDISIQIAADVDKSYDLLDGDELNINGVTFTAKNEADGFNGSAGQIKTNMNQSAEDLAIAVQEAIDNHISKKGTDYQKLEGVKVERNGSKLTLTNHSAGAAGESLFLKTGGNARITGGADKYFSNVALQADGASKGVTSLSNMSIDAYGTIKDSVLKGIAGEKADASFTIATNPAANSGGGTLANGEIVTNGSSDSLTVNMAGHGFKDGVILNFGGPISLSAGGLTAGAGDYTVKVLDEDHFQISSAALTGDYDGLPGVSDGGGDAYTIDQAEQQGDRVVVNGVEFKYVDNLSGEGNEIEIGADVAETTINTIEALNKSTDARVAVATYAAGDAAGEITATYNAKGDGDDFQFTLGGAGYSANLTITDSSLTGGTSREGVDFSGVTNNDAFVGKLSGFKSEYANAANRVNLSVKVGEYNYRAENVKTNPIADEWITLVSEEQGGGSFKVQVAANEGINVTGAGDAQSFAKKLNNAFEDLTLVQKRKVDSFDTSGGDIYNGTNKVGSLNGAAMFLNNNKFDNIKITDVSVKNPGTGQTDAVINMKIDGQVYVSEAGIGEDLDKGSLIKLVNENDANRYVELRLGGTDFDISSAANAEAIQQALSDALGVEDGTDAGIDFQVGVSSADVINVRIDSAKTDNIYVNDNGGSMNLDISTQAGAQEALNVVTNAINKVNELRASVGVNQSRFDFASSAISSSVQNQDAARGAFLDADIANESTNLAMAQVRMNASIATLAQANQIPQNLLKLLG